MTAEERTSTIRTIFMIAAIACTVYGLVGMLAGFASPIGVFSAWRTHKMIASGGFVALAVAAGAFETDYGRAVLVATVLCQGGDLALSLRGPLAFPSGLGLFLTAHLVLIAAFWLRGTNRTWTLVGLAATVPVDVALVVWLLPLVPAGMRLPILAYLATITAMVAAAIGTRGAGGPLLIPLGAIAFFLSDITVARHYVGLGGKLNHYVGLPLYYMGVTMIAASIRFALEDKASGPPPPAPPATSAWTPGQPVR
ncbi:MAG: lysoplasmalogenase [Candidatus Hydrogenedentes bacterium]|nr:lysoplasmalogenase [Candidatus Hydrogenedentota bacterium]